jgi:hypothetical protein
MHSAQHAHHSLAMHFATFVFSNAKAFDPIIELEQAKCVMAAQQ